MEFFWIMAIGSGKIYCNSLEINRISNFEKKIEKILDKLDSL